jgi:WD40 repeat protein
MRSGYARRLVQGWASWLGVALLVLGALRVVDGVIGGDGPRMGSGEEDPPAAQVSRDDFGSPVWALAITPRGTSLGAATIGGEIRIKDLASARSMRLGSGPMSSARSLTISPDGRVLAIAGLDTAVTLWDMEGGGILGALEIDGGAPKSVAFQPAGRLLAVGGSRRSGVGTLSLWEWHERRQSRSLEGHEGCINALAFSEDGSILTSADVAGVVKVWDVPAGRELASWDAGRPGNAVKAMALSPDGKVLATAGHLEGEVGLWDAPGGRPRDRLRANGAGVNGLAFSPDGRLLALANLDGSADIFDVARAHVVGSIRATARSIESVSFVDLGRMLATGGSDGSLRLWDLEQVLGPRRFAAR